MAKARRNIQFESEICRALGLNPSNVSELTLKLSTHAPHAEVIATMFVEPSSIEGIREIIKKYELNPLEIKN